MVIVTLTVSATRNQTKNRQTLTEWERYFSKKSNWKWNLTINLNHVRILVLTLKN